MPKYIIQRYIRKLLWTCITRYKQRQIKEITGFFEDNQTMFPQYNSLFEEMTNYVKFVTAAPN